MSDTFKKNLISWGNTFISAFILTVAASLSIMGSIEWTSAFWIPIVLTGLRAGIAELVKILTPVKLGGYKL